MEGYTATAVAHDDIEFLQITRSELQAVIAKLPSHEKQAFRHSARRSLGFREHHVRYVLGQM